MEALVGRTAELAALLQARARAAAGSPCVVLVEGPPGIGKTSLVHAALDDGRTAQLRAQAEPDDAALDGAVLRQLVGVDVTFGADGVAAVSALMERLDDVQRHAPVTALVVEDAQWADDLSLRAVLAAFQRLRQDRVLLVLSARTGWTGGTSRAVEALLANGRGRRLVLLGVDTPAVRQLAERCGHPGLGRSRVLELREHTAGNPLHLLELFRTVPPEQLADTAELPAPPSIAATARQRFDALDGDTRRLVAAVAVLGGSPTLRRVAKVGGVRGPDAALDVACGQGLVRRTATAGTTRVTVHHLLAVAVRQLLPQRELAALHRAAALQSDDRTTALRHRAAVADPDDTALVGDLLRHADELAAAGAHTAAAAQAGLAADLELERVPRDALCLRAAELLLCAADAPGAARWLARTSDRTSARSRYVHGWLAFVQGDADGARRALTTAWRTASERQDERTASRCAHVLAWLHLTLGQGEGTVAWARRVTRDEAVMLGSATAALALGQTISGRARQALRQLPPVPAEVSERSTDLHAVRGVLRLYLDDLVGARADLRSVLGSTRQRGNHQRFFQAHANLAELEQRAGNWDAAVVHGQIAVSATVETGFRWLHGPVCALAATVPARRGQWEDAQALVDAAAAAADGGDRLSTAYAQAAAAQLADSRGDWAAVVETTEALVAMVASGYDGVGEPGTFDWQELRAEGLARSGRWDEAVRAVEALSALAAQRQLRSAAAGADRVRGVLETERRRPHAAALAFARAAEAFHVLGFRFAHARTLADWSLAQRSWAAYDEAAATRALCTPVLEELGAQPFLARLTGDAGGAATRGAAAGVLRPQELAIAVLVAEGLTNRQIARELVLSEKTVEFHLSRAYRRLGLRGRGQLAALVGTRNAGAVDPGAAADLGQI